MLKNFFSKLKNFQSSITHRTNTNKQTVNQKSTYPIPIRMIECLVFTQQQNPKKQNWNLEEENFHSQERFFFLFFFCLFGDRSIDDDDDDDTTTRIYRSC